MGRRSHLLGLVCVSGLLLAGSSGDLSERVFPESDSEGTRVLLQPHPGRAPLEFEVDRAAQRILVFEVGAESPLQSLFCDWTEGPPRGRSGLSARDYDGDGARDLEVISWWGATGNTGYLVFLFDPDSRRFAPAPMYSGHSSPEPDGTGCILTGGVAGHAGAIHARARLCPRGDRLEPRWTERQDHDREAGHYVFTRKEWNAEGALVSTRVEHRRRGENGLETFWSQETPADSD